MEDILDFWVNLKNISHLTKFHIYPSLLSLFWEHTKLYLLHFQSFQRNSKTLEPVAMSTTSASSLVLPSLSPKTLAFYNSKPTSFSLLSSSSSHKLLAKPISISSCFIHSFQPLPSSPSRFVRNVAVSSEFDQEEDLLSDEDGSNFSPDLKLFVGNLPFSVDSAQLAGLFETAGNVEMVEVPFS